MKTRGERREQSKRKWLSRVKRVYNSGMHWYIPVNGIKSGKITRKNRKICESIVDFLNDSKYAKILKNCTVPYRTTMEKIESKIKNRKDRHNSKKRVKQEAEEPITWFDCFSCTHFNHGNCDKNYKNLNGSDCPDYYD
jgi:hypothetical protein|nr:MAG TPA: hypothetical protein [Bacteriophage sp.]